MGADHHDSSSDYLLWGNSKLQPLSHPHSATTMSFMAFPPIM